MRIVLQYTDRSFDRIKTRPTALQNFAARPERVFESSAIFLLFLRRHFASLDCAGATMDRELDFLPGHCGDRKSTRLNSSHSQISYAVFCLKKKNKVQIDSVHMY